MKLRFLGAAGTVTGSRLLLESHGTRVLVDCGLFQGLKELRLRNWEPFPVDPASLDAGVLTHAHIDHTGYLPRLVREGFAGPVYCTPGTRGLCDILLPDAGYLQEEQARYANKRGHSKHRPALPLYTIDDARAAMERLRPVPMGAPFFVGVSQGEDLRLTFHPAGHILGAASVRISDGRRSVVFSGDVGRPHDLTIPAPAPLQSPDYLILECTYGNRRHREDDPAAELCEVVRRTVGRGGVVVIPAFAVGRSQAVLHLLAEAMAEGKIPEVPVYLNSPMAISVTDLFMAYPEGHRLTEVQVDRIASMVRYVRTAEESKWLNKQRGPMIVLSASGMATGGRILHHLKAFAPDSRNAIVFAGYQAAGTRGEAMVSGVDQVKIHGSYTEVRAEVVQIGGLSAHADYQELMDWLRQVQPPPLRTFLVHGEPSAAEAMCRHVRDFLGWEVHIAKNGEEVSCG